MISGSRQGWRMPLAFACSSHKNTENYLKIFNLLKSDQPNLMVKQINLDFEQAAIKAAKEVFGSSKIQGCYFHLLQSIIRNLGTNHLKERYETDVTFASEIRQMSGLAYLPVEKVRFFFVNLTRLTFDLVFFKRDDFNFLINN